jgi:hypothetical protein
MEAEDGSVPAYEKKPLLRQVRLNPESFHDAFLDLPRTKQDRLLQLLGEEPGLTPRLLVRIVPPAARQDPLLQAIIDGRGPSSPSTMQAQLFTPKKDTKEEDALPPPRFRQNPLLKQLLTEPAVYREAFLLLPDTERATIMRILRKEGGKAFNMSALSPRPGEGVEPELSQEGMALRCIDRSNTYSHFIQLYSFSAFTIGPNSC